MLETDADWLSTLGPVPSKILSHFAYRRLLPFQEWEELAVWLTRADTEMQDFS